MLEPVDPLSIVFYRPDALRVWEHPLMRERLKWYYSVMRDEKPAKYLIVKRIESPINPYDRELSIDELWSVHRELSKEFQKVFMGVRGDRLSIEELSKPEYSFLDVKIAIAWRIMASCKLCERKCRVNRVDGGAGVCLMNGECIVHSYFHHMGEEAPLVPSGTIFYGGCNLKCVYCQNWDISQVNPTYGLKVDPKTLAKIQYELRRTGARNINHVGGDPTPQIPFILESLKYLEVNVPQLWNSNMYLTLESMELIKDVIDIWLPDFKYGNNSCAKKLSLVDNYYEVVTRNLSIAYRNGDMIIRHLVLPNHLDCCTKPVLEWISRNTPYAVVNVMDQYRPEHLVLKYPEKYREISRRLSYREIDEAYGYARRAGFTVYVEDLWLKP